MKTIGVQELSGDPNMLSQSAGEGSFVLVTDHNKPIFLSIPFDDALLRSGVHINVAVKCYEEGTLTLVKAAQLANMPVEAFMKTLADLGVVVVDQSAEELEADLKTVSGSDHHANS